MAHKFIEIAGVNTPLYWILQSRKRWYRGQTHWNDVIMITTLTGCLYLGKHFCDVGAVVDEGVEVGYYSFTWLEEFCRGGGVGVESESVSVSVNVV